MPAPETNGKTFLKSPILLRYYFGGLLLELILHLWWYEMVSRTHVLPTVFMFWPEISLYALPFVLSKLLIPYSKANMRRRTQRLMNDKTPFTPVSDEIMATYEKRKCKQAIEMYMRENRVSTNLAKDAIDKTLIQRAIEFDDSEVPPEVIKLILKGEEDKAKTRYLEIAEGIGMEEYLERMRVEAKERRLSRDKRKPAPTVDELLEGMSSIAYFKYSRIVQILELKYMVNPPNLKDNPVSEQIEAK